MAVFNQPLYLKLSTSVTTVPVTVLVWGLVTIVAWVVQRYFLIGKYRKYRALPPGPPSSIIFGTPGYPREKAHIFFREVSKKYGEIVTVWDGPKLQIVLNSPKVIHDLCVKRGTNYNSRPKQFAFHDNIFRGVSIATSGYNDEWRRQRKIFNSISGPAASKNFIPYQYYETKQYLYELLKAPESFFQATERCGASILTSSVYGLRADTLSDPSALGLILVGAWLEANIHPTAFIDDRWPILQKIPNILAPWRHVYKENASILDRIAASWWDSAKVNQQKGKLVPCFASKFLTTFQSEGFTKSEAALVSLGLLIVGSGTTASIHNMLIAGCVLNPEVVEMAHQELDRVVGPSRLPTLEDEPNLPYIRAMVKETLRWRPFSNQGLYHASINDDVYNDYFIPAGTTIVANAYSVHNDESRWPNPDKFDPSRYIDYKLGALESANLSDPEQRDHFAYGAGRRICAGVSAAEPTLFLLASRMLWGFNIGWAKDKEGNNIPINTMAYAGGVFAKPEPFAASVTCRSPQHAEIIEQEFKNAHTDVRSMVDASKAGDMPEMKALVEELKVHPNCQATMTAMSAMVAAAAAGPAP
ncbi:cytochrome P450 [Leptodontidium sp. 2 PMI_412]|nr:cytochrome P450 [Leptodontidium sp. 2 PMI_412]